MSKKRDELRVFSKSMTLLQCLGLVEKIERDLQTLIDHEMLATPQVVMKDVQLLSMSLERLASKGGDR